MSQGTFLDKLIRSEAFKRIFVFRPEIDFLQRKMIFGQNTDILFKASNRNSVPVYIP